MNKKNKQEKETVQNEQMNMIVASSNDMATIMASINTIAMILIKTVINRVVVRPMFQQTLRDITTRN